MQTQLVFPSTDSIEWQLLPTVLTVKQQKLNSIDSVGEKTSAAEYSLRIDQVVMDIRSMIFDAINVSNSWFYLTANTISYPKVNLRDVLPLIKAFLGL